VQNRAIHVDAFIDSWFSLVLFMIQAVAAAALINQMKLYSGEYAVASTSIYIISSGNMGKPFLFQQAFSWLAVP